MTAHDTMVVNAVRPSFIHLARRPARDRHWEQWRRAGREPTISAMLDDPIVRLVMQRDGLTADDVRQVDEQARESLRAGLGELPKCVATWRS